MEKRFTSLFFSKLVTIICSLRSNPDVIYHRLYAETNRLAGREMNLWSIEPSTLIIFWLKITDKRLVTKYIVKNIVYNKFLCHLHPQFMLTI